MFNIILTFFAALSLATIAACFSVAGIITIFAGNITAALVMGAAIEFSKIVGIGWLYRNWKTASWIKYPLVLFTAAAMIITSIGIYGFLMKAFEQQSRPLDSITVQIQTIDQKIERSNLSVERWSANIQSLQKELSQLDGQIDVLIENGRISDPTKGAVALRDKQRPDRDRIQSELDKNHASITKAQDEMLELQLEKNTLESSVRDVERELGPMKHLSTMIFGEGEDVTAKAVNLLILLIMIAFDPFAIFLLMAAQHLVMKRGEEKLLAANNVMVTSPDSEHRLETDANVEDEVAQSNDITNNDVPDEANELADIIPQVEDEIPSIIPAPKMTNATEQFRVQLRRWDMNVMTTPISTGYSVDVGEVIEPVVDCSDIEHDGPDDDVDHPEVPIEPISRDHIKGLITNVI